ncbi:MAG: PIN domain-containing protein [Gemmatimonadaceae bacterium]|nr:PIN domain-containing protein [Gemmatimonadaceae bacterium]
MIYIDTSVVLAHLLSETRVPPSTLWGEFLVSSRLLEYELWNRINALGLGKSHGQLARDMLGRLALVELLPTVLARSLEPFPTVVRTLDALHLSTVDYLRNGRQDVTVATYDGRMATAARAMGFRLFEL